MYCKIFALHFKSCPMTYCMSIIPKKKYLSRLQQKIKARVCSASVLYFSFFLLILNIVRLKALSHPVSFPQCVQCVLKLIESLWDRKKIFNNQCIIPSNFFTSEDVSATKQFLRSSYGVLLRFLYLAIDCALPEYLRTAHGVLRVFFLPHVNCVPCALFFFFKYWWFNVHLYNCMENKQEINLRTGMIGLTKCFTLIEM